ncbi:hypothetical protein NFI96_021262, partial [Prochilodus magdalenae]
DGAPPLYLSMVSVQVQFRIMEAPDGVPLDGHVNGRFGMGVTFPSMCVFLGLITPCARAAESSNVWVELALSEKDQLGPPYLRLPVFLHSRVPLLDKAQFSPARGSGLERLPERVRKVLAPLPAPTRASGAENGRNGLRVACSAQQMRVKVPRVTVGSGEGLRLGTCDVSWSTKQHLIFLHGLHQCGTRREVGRVPQWNLAGLVVGEGGHRLYGGSSDTGWFRRGSLVEARSVLQIINNRVVYSNTLHNDPVVTSGSEKSPPSFSIPVQCHFNRFHYSYKMGFVPQVEPLRIFKPMRTRAGVSLSACDGQWNRLNSSGGFVVGQPMYFELEVPSVAEGEQLYVNSCHVTVNSSRLSVPRLSVIENYGCMVDSRSSGGSRFVRSSRRNVVRFSVEAFVFQGKLAKQLYMHCEATVGSVTPSATSKFCSYSQQQSRWEELYGFNAVCSCCDSTCLSGAPTAEGTLPQVDEQTGGVKSDGATLESMNVEHLTTVQKENTAEPRRTFEEVFGLD